MKFKVNLVQLYSLGLQVGLMLKHMLIPSGYFPHTIVFIYYGLNLVQS